MFNMMWFPLQLLAQVTPDVTDLTERIEGVNVGKLAIAAMIIAVALVVNRVACATLERLGEGRAKRRLFFKKVESFTRLGILIIAGYLVVGTFFNFEEDRAALLGLGGTLAVAIGFALKDTTSSLMAGILILFDQPFQVGDFVQFEDVYGEVTEIGLRSVRIVTADDNEVSIPNNKFLTEVVVSGNSGALDMMVVMKFHIAMSADFDLARRIVYEACITSKYVFLEKKIGVAVHETTTPMMSTVIVCKAYVIDTRFEMAFDSDVTQKVKRAFREHDIYPPYTRQYTIRDTGWDDFGHIRERSVSVAEAVNSEPIEGRSAIESSMEPRDEVAATDPRLENVDQKGTESRDVPLNDPVRPESASAAIEPLTAPLGDDTRPDNAGENIESV